MILRMPSFPRGDVLNQLESCMSSNTNPSSKNPSYSGKNKCNDQKPAIDPTKLLPTPNELISLLNRRVIGQTDAKRSIATAVYHHFLSCARSDLFGGRVEGENHVMLVGPTGSGKSLLLMTLGEILKLPTFHVSCTTITPDGYKGKNFAQHLEAVSEVLVNGSKTTPGIVIWDEVDKLSLTGFGDQESVEQASVYRRMIQAEFLTYLDGTKWGSDGMDTARILNIGIGAFVGLDRIRSTSAKPVVGFHTAHHEHDPILEPIKPDHLIRYGLIPEFVGRFSRIACLEPLDHDSMRRILLEAENNVLARRKDFFALHGIKLKITDPAIDELISRALVHGTGARALRHEVDQVLRQLEHCLPDMAYGGIDALVIDRDTVMGSAPVREHNGGNNDLSKLLEIRLHAMGRKRNLASEAGPDDLSIF
jgi:ATP-dependent Clp protease ATP-binding subunit ClpX